MKIETKISLLAFASVLVVAGIITGMVWFQKQRLGSSVGAIVNQQAASESAKLSQSVYNNCVALEERNRNRLKHGLMVGRETIRRLGGISLAPETVEWQAVDQISGNASVVALPKMLVGKTWLGQNVDTNVTSPVVDEVMFYTRDPVTIFQRINEEGDMLRVCSSVRNAKGLRATGTYISHRNADGSANAVVSAVLKGETYLGRAMVVGEWNATGYEPIWDAQHERVIGMLYTGVNLRDMNKELRQSIMKGVVGKTGYIFVLGAKGDQRGRYMVSKDGLRDGESLWEAKDADGRLFIQSMVTQALQATNNSVVYERYPWKNEGDKTARMKIAALTYYEPWDWVIGAGAYEDDFAEGLRMTDGALRRMIQWTGLVALVAGFLSWGVSRRVARSIAGPITEAVEALSDGAGQTLSASEQIAGSSQSLAEGASEQAASLEETSSSLEEMASMAQRNSEHAHKAKGLSGLAREAADAGAHQMHEMSAAMASIKRSSNDMKTAMDAVKASNNEVSKIIKTIDEIAFQTNILALNAAVEAARAGDAGMGFSVVADEVRSLAQKSAMAARETTEKIEASMGRTDEGVRVSGQLNASLEVVEHKAGQVEQQLQNILARSREVDGLIADISSASAEQSQGISQVTQAVAQIDQVVQRTAANAEESAGAAEELQSQVLSQKEVIGRLQRLVTGQNENRDQTYPSKAPVPEQKTQTLREPKRIIRTPALAMSTRQGD